MQSKGGTKDDKNYDMRSVLSIYRQINQSINQSKHNSGLIVKADFNEVKLPGGLKSIVFERKYHFEFE